MWSLSFTVLSGWILACLNLLGLLTLLPLGVIFHAFCHLLVQKILLPGILSVCQIVWIRSNSLDPDQARHNVGPDMGPNCLQKLSADNTRR